MSMPFSMQVADERYFLQSQMWVTWEITKACALHCTPCRADAQTRRAPAELSTVEGKRLIDQIVEFDTPTLEITGGDPFERPDLFELLTYAIAKGLHVTLSPSITDKFNPQMVHALREIGVSNIALGVDAPSADAHDQYRGVAGSFIGTMDLLRVIRSVGMRIHINTSVGRRTVGYLHEIEHLVSHMGASVWNLFFLVPGGRVKQEDILTGREHEHVVRWLAKREKDVPYRIFTTEGQQFHRIRIQREIGTDAHNLMCVKNHMDQLTESSGHTQETIFISHTGKVYPSPFMPVAVGDVRYESLRRIYDDSPILKSLRNVDGFRGKCGYCEFNHLCGGSRARAYALTGDYLETDPSCVYQPLAVRRASGRRRIHQIVSSQEAPA